MVIENMPAEDIALPKEIERLVGARNQRTLARPGWMTLALRVLPYTLLTVTLINGLIGVIAILTPYLHQWFGASVTDPVYTAYSFICPQRHSHTFHIDGSPMAFEQRDVAMHMGFFVAGLLYLTGSMLRGPLPHRVLVAGVLPLLIDVGLSTAGLMPSTWESRLWTGMLASFVIVWWSFPRYDAYLTKVQRIVAPRRQARMADELASTSAH